jgi:hypothetical protein
MNIQTILRISGIILVAVAVSLIMLGLVYALQDPHLAASMVTIGWNV